MDDTTLRTLFHGQQSAAQAAQDQLVRGIVSTIARGSVNLQLGKYVTEKDKQKMRREMQEYVIQMPS